MSSDQSIIQNDRRHHRISHRVSVLIEHVGHSGSRAKFQGQTVNLSASGIAVTLPASYWGTPTLRARVRVAFKLGKQEIHCWGQVVRIIEQPGEARVVGIELDRVRYSVMAGIKNLKGLWLEMHEDPGNTRVLRQ